MALYLIRHGQTIANAENRFQGYLDTPLTQTGIHQAKAYGAYFEHMSIDKVFLSPAKRVLTTYKYMNMDKAYHIDNRLQEICYGKWEGLQKDTIIHSPLWKQREQNRCMFVHPGFYINVPGERYQDLYDRLNDFWKETEFRTKNVLVLAHRGVLMCAKAYFSKNTASMDTYRPDPGVILMISDADVISVITL